MDLSIHQLLYQVNMHQIHFVLNDYQYVVELNDEGLISKITLDSPDKYNIEYK